MFPWWKNDLSKGPLKISLLLPDMFLLFLLGEKYLTINVKYGNTFILQTSVS